MLLFGDIVVDGGYGVEDEADDLSTLLPLVVWTIIGHNWRF